MTMPEDVREKILREALVEVPSRGFTDGVLTAAADRAGVTLAEAHAVFPDGAAGLIAAFSLWADRAMERRMQALENPSVRARITAAVRARLEALSPHREATRRAAAFLALPQNGVLAARLLFESVDAMWRAAGDRSSDFNYYTKRGLLAGVYASAFVYWLSDASDGHEATWKFLDARIADVMNIQKARGTIAESLSKLPDPLGILAALRSPAP